jgi:hypothetical protein
MKWDAYSVDLCNYVDNNTVIQQKDDSDYCMATWETYGTGLI